MNVRVKWSLARAKAKLRRWERQVDKETVESLREYGAVAATAMVKCTPPSHKGTTPARALSNLKARIQRDFEGDGLEPFSDEDIVWFTLGDGTRIARFKYRGDARPSPFRVMQGRVSKKALAAMNVGKWRVEFVKGDLGGFMRKAGQYYMGRSGSTYRLKWRGTRHVTTMGAVRAEIRRRQRLAGQLMAGWKPLAHAAGTKLPAAVEKQTGKGSAKIKHSMLHKAVLEGRNSGHYPELQKLVNRQIPWILKRNRALAKKRARATGKKLKK